MSLLISALCIMFACLIGVWGGAMLRMHYDEELTSKGIAGTLIVLNDDEEAYLFLDMDMKPEELANQKEVIFKIETRK